MRQHCVVVGAGISGLAAAWHLKNHYPQVRVTVVDSADRVGGKIAAGAISGLAPLDVGAESVLARRPEALDLIEQVGLGSQVVHPKTSTASIWSRGSLRSMPPRTLLGIPSDPQTLLGLLSAEEVERVRREVIPAPAAGVVDISIGDLVSLRLGDAVVDRLIEPLLGGVYAGHSRHISAAAALPLAFAAHQQGQSLVQAASTAIPSPPTGGASAPPVFAGVRGGLHRLPSTLAHRLTQADVPIRTGLTVRGLTRRGARFALECGPVPTPEIIDADMVVLATPAPPTARLLASVVPAASSILATIEVASMAIITLALPSREVPDLSGSGILVPPVEDLTVKAATFSSNKWDWVDRAGHRPSDDDLTVVRASIGRHGETEALRHTDADLIPIVLDDLRRMGIDLPSARRWQVQRWGGALPQYAPGHVQRVETVQAAIEHQPGLAVCGAAYQGVGIPACIASGRAAAEQVAASH
ncbi:MAG: protoporphyrinogen oxidase [Ornithinimicrobium sp.]